MKILVYLSWVLLLSWAWSGAGLAENLNSAGQIFNSGGQLQESTTDSSGQVFNSGGQLQESTTNSSGQMLEIIDSAGQANPDSTEPPKVEVGIDESGNSGLVSDSLTIKVGYYGQDYQIKRVFSRTELESMANLQQVYSIIDRMPAVVLDSVRGVSLKAILEAAGIDPNSVETFYFYCKDLEDAWYQDLSKSYLLERERYYYPHLPTNWDEEEQKALAGAESDPIKVEAVLAVADNWQRFATEGDFSQLSPETSFRLIFGQTDLVESTAVRMAKWVHTIEIMLGGKPPEETWEQLPEDFSQQEVGSIANQSPPPPAPEVAPAEISPEVTEVEAPLVEPPAAELSNSEGGIQNWRIYEMAETAQALPLVEADNRLWLPVSGGGLFLLLLGAVIQVWFYRKAK